MALRTAMILASEFPGAIVVLVVSLFALGLILVQRPAPKPARRLRIQGARADDVESMLRLARDAAAHQRVEEALAWLRAACSLAPQLAVAHFCRGMCLTGIGQDEEAYAALRCAHLLEPGNADYRLALARACARTGRAAEALPLLASLVREDPALAASLAPDPAFAILADHPLWLAMLGAL